MKKFCFLLCFLFCSLVFAEGLCDYSLFLKNQDITLKSSFINREYSREHLDIFWKHRTKTDTFEIKNSKNKTLIFIVEKEKRHILLENGIKRQLAKHHLRESVFSTPLRLDDLELLSKGTFFCQTDSSQNKIATANSEMWYHFFLSESTEPFIVKMSGYKSYKRTLFLKWESYENKKYPAEIRFYSNKNETGILWIHSISSKSGIKTDPILPFIKMKEIKPMNILQLHEKLFCDITVIKTPFCPHK